ncbi:MAG: GNAT family N-acetyltransferase [Bacteroidetes bacterium]|nr:GNAT family N-acetyltransferase [Bacteroidota bacterium]
MNIHHIVSKELSRGQVERVIRLQDKVWPKEKNMAKEMNVRIDEYLVDEEDPYEVFILTDGDEILAHAEIFPRVINTTQGEMEIMGLASVCSPPDRRGEGFGRKIVLEAFKSIDNGRFNVTLFQTGVPEFYEKLGAIRIGNSCVNSLAKGGIDRSPWWNPYTMIYPGNYTNWPEGEIDLLGKGY